MRRSSATRITTLCAVGALLVAARVASAQPGAAATGADPGGLAEALRATAALGEPGERFVPGELVVKLRARAGARAHEGVARGFGALLGDADARALDAALAKHRVTRMRRVFHQLEDARGRLRTDARERAAQSRQRHAARSLRRRATSLAPRLEDVYVLELSGPADARAAAAELRQLADVVYAEPNWIYRTAATPLPALPFVPDDRFVSQDGATWSEGAFGQSFPDLWGLEKTGAIPAWNAFDLDGSGAFEPGERRPGEGVVVAVIDTGVDYLHPDLADNIWTNPGEIASNEIDDDANGQVDDVRGWNFAAGSSDPMDAHGHGTHVAGSIGALADDAIGIAGLAPWVRIMPVAGLGAGGTGSSATLAAAVVYAAENGADILSNSWGGPDSSVVADAFAFADSVGALAVAAAGNNGSDFSSISPANLPSVIAVAALEPDDRRASFSNFGIGIDVGAPGTQVLSLSAQGSANALALQRPERVVETDYLWLSGTSMACPHVSGALAVLISRFPGASADELRGRLRAGARSVDAANPGLEGLLGSGALDLPASLVATPAPIVQLTGLEPPDLPIGGGSVALVVRLENFWTTASGVSGVLSSDAPELVIEDATASFGDVPIGETRSNDLEPFAVEIAPDIAPGSVVELTLTLSGDGGFAETFPIQMNVPYFQDTTLASELPASGQVPFHVTFQDYGGDGLPDVLAIGFGSLGLFRNLGGGVFADARTESRILISGFGLFQSIFFDADHDGDREIAIAGNGNSVAPTYFFVNQGDGTFRNRSTASGTANQAFSSFVAADYDGDGWTDILGGGVARLGLLRNNGDGTFSDVAAAAGFAIPGGLTPGLVWQVATFDYDSDGDPDVVGVCDRRGIFLLRNEGDGTFTDALGSSGIDNSRGRGLALAVADYDADGDVDLFVTGIGAPAGGDRNALYRNEGDGSFRDVTAESGDLALGNASGFVGTDFFDFDNDGDLDLFLAAEGVPNEVFYHVLYRNEGDGRFAITNDAAFPKGFRPGAAAAGIGDYDADGSLDIYAVDGFFGGLGRGGLLRNRIGSRNRFLRVHLEGATRDPYGARVRVFAGGRAQLREVHSSPVEPLPLHFGLGDARWIDRIEITWPDGSVQRLADVPADQEIAIQQPGVFCDGVEDADADGVVDSCDNCTGVPNPGQEDTDADGEGDACNDHLDADGDEWSNFLDVCASDFDPGQEDVDGDLVGDACPIDAVPAASLPLRLALAAALLALGARALGRAGSRAG